MKKIVLVFSLVLFLILYSNTFSQIDTSDYFPIKTGNYWEYWGIENWTTNWIMMSIESLGDTVMSNGKSYQVFEEIIYISSISPWIIYFYLRSEGKIIYCYSNEDSCSSQEYIFYDFEKVDSAIWPICYEYASNYRGIENTSLYYSSTLNVQYEGKFFNWVEVNEIDTTWAPMGSPYVDLVGKGIGITYRWMWDFSVFYIYGAKINNQVYGTLTSIDDTQNVVNKYYLSQNYPNPFNPSTSIQYAISSTQFVTLKVYDLLGREVATLVNEEKPAGVYNAQFTMNNLPAGRQGVQLSSGIYFYKLQAGDFVETKKMLLLK